MKIMKGIWKLLKWSAVIVIVLFVVLFAINWVDQPPSPANLQLRSVLEDSAGVPDEVNAYIYLFGFDAPKEEDPWESGSECIAKTNDLLLSRDPIQVLEFDCWDHDSFSQDDNAKPSALDACQEPDQDCEQALNAEKSQLIQWLDERGWLLKRYLGLLAYRKWHSSIVYSLYMPLPGYGAVLEAQKMLLIKAWLLAGEGKCDEVKELLSQDARFWRTALANSDLLIHKMVAAASLRRHFIFSNLVFRRLHANGVSPSIPEEWLIPLGKDELSLKLMLAGEWAFGASVIRDAIREEAGLIYWIESDDDDAPGPIESAIDRLAAHFLLPQATENSMAELALQLSDILDVPVEQLPGALEQAEEYVHGQGDTNLFLHPYNPVGNILASLALPSYTSYASRVYNLEGARRAAVLTARLRGDGVPATQVDSALGQADLRNPYDGSPFAWEESTGSIVFEGLGSDDRSTFRFLY